MTSKKPIVDLVAGARPNFIKLAPVVRALRADGRMNGRIVHTGDKVPLWDGRTSERIVGELWKLAGK